MNDDPNSPTKCYWMGEDIDTLPAERLREIVRELGRLLESTRDTAQSVIGMANAVLDTHSRRKWG